MQIFARGTGKGSGPVEYITSPLGLIFDEKGKIGRTVNGKPLTYERDPPPVVLRGNPSHTVALIDSLGFKFKYTSGVLSFAPEDGLLSEQLEAQVIDDFERIAFAGLASDQYSCLWVRHVHQEHHELHFVIPRVELTTGKSLNITPPGYMHYFDPWRSLWNQKQHWADPDDPARAQLLRQPDHQVKINASSLKKQITDAASVEQVVTEYLTDLCHAGVLKDRSDVVQALKDAELTVHRQGKNYLSVRADQQSKSTRLKGLFYDESFTAERFFATLTDKSGNKSAGNRKNDAERIQRLEQDVAAAVERRAQFNRIRYSRKSRRSRSSCETTNRTEYAADSGIENLTEIHLGQPAPDCDKLLARHLFRELGADAIHGEYDTTSIPTETDACTRNQPAITCVRTIGSKNLGTHISRNSTGSIPDPARERNRRARLDNERWQTGYQDFIKSIRDFYDSVRTATDQHYAAVIRALDAANQSRIRINADINTALGALIESNRKIEQWLMGTNNRLMLPRHLKNDHGVIAVNECTLEANMLLEGLSTNDNMSRDKTLARNALEQQATFLAFAIKNRRVK